MTILVTGAGGFIGGHMVQRLFQETDDIILAVDIKPLDDWQLVSPVTNIDTCDLRHAEEVRSLLLRGIDTVYNFAADMGGMGFIETHKAECMMSVLINTNLLNELYKVGATPKYFYASSACVYPDYRQDKIDNPALQENDAYPAMPEDGYGWEKLFSERMCRHYKEDRGFDVRIARFHNVYGTHTEWCGGREKAPAAICRKILESLKKEPPTIEIWGDGEQTRSFMFVDDCIEGVSRLMASDYTEPLNIGSSELVSINDLVSIVEDIAGVEVARTYNLDAPKGVRGRNSDNTKIQEVLGWEPSIPLKDGLAQTYNWIRAQMALL